MSQQGVFGLEVPPGGVLIPVSLELPATVCLAPLHTPRDIAVVGFVLLGGIGSFCNALLFTSARVADAMSPVRTIPITNVRSL